MAEQRINYVAEDVINDPEMIAELERCAKFGTPRPESQAIRAHRPPIMKAFATVWKDSFHEGVVEHKLKELCRVYVSRSVKCEYCGNQRSEKGRSEGLVEDDYMDLLNFEKSDNYDARQKAALAYTEAITWDIQTDDALWARLHEHFSEPEIVELGFFIALTMGQQRWLRTLNIQHHSFMAGTSASMAPGFEDAASVSDSKRDDGYWAKP
ncbi:MAG: carboxymuconolactone decarboxylase family protein [Gammaproteobacteria bacterium]|nr:carboxymuconolactone decarboxylase family protein [Gammaproteobacteria bacterium]